MTNKEALEKARAELSQAEYLSETATKAGIIKINSNKAEWLSKVICLAEKSLEEQEAAPKIIYKCDKLKCKKCSVFTSGCEHTTDITHAINFENKSGTYVEK